MLKNHQTPNSWQLAQQEILVFLMEFLYQIEWHYGDNRAPFHYPPEFSLIMKPDGRHIYQCSIETDLGVPEERILMTADSPESLPEAVRCEILGRFSPSIE